MKLNDLSDLLEFKIVASEVGDENSKSEAQITVAIIDINDNKPKFDQNFYNLTIIPKSIVGSKLHLSNADSISVSDPDKVFIKFAYFLLPFYLF